ncbi:unnamed protein product [Prunus armeniaca]|uniref:Uncharacterized protein n=1 Tax=Prunus armeniaca TaxID=36596 RepID=A0A6J5VDZ9_PRUAR|nr:unnamed protein product [Prunus armeniaca]
MMQLSLYKLWRQRDFGTQTCEGRGELRSSNEKATKASDALKAVHEQPESHTPKSNKKGKRASKQRFTVVTFGDFSPTNYLWFYLSYCSVEPFAVEATLIEIGVGSRPVRRLMLVWSCKLCDTVFGCYH